MVEIGRVRVKAGNAPIEQKISAYPPQADICAFVSTSLETKRAARRPSQGSGRPKCKREGVAEDALGQSLPKWAVHPMSAFPPLATIKRTSLVVRFVPTADAARQGVWSAIESQRVSTRWVASSVGTTSVTR